MYNEGLYPGRNGRVINGEQSEVFLNLKTNLTIRMQIYVIETEQDVSQRIGQEKDVPGRNTVPRPLILRDADPCPRIPRCHHLPPHLQRQPLPLPHLRHHHRLLLLRRRWFHQWFPDYSCVTRAFPGEQQPEQSPVRTLLGLSLSAERDGIVSCTESHRRSSSVTRKSKLPNKLFDH